MLKSIAESLAGRAVFLDLESLSLNEISGHYPENTLISAWFESPSDILFSSPERFFINATLYELIWKGFLPETRFIDPELIPDFYTAYLRTYIERDVRLLAQLRPTLNGTINQAEPTLYDNKKNTD